MKKICIGLTVFFLAACLRLDDLGAETTPTVTPSATLPPTSSPTVIWFPPTETPVVTPTLEITPTPGVMVEIGEVLYADQFNSPEGWSLPQNERGQINIGNGEVSIIINEPGIYLAATRDEPDVGDFYAEITVSPILCSARDEYGFLFSVIGSGQYYRVALSCSGEIRLDRYVSGVTTTLYPWTRSASVPVGAPSVTKLAVLVAENEIHIYVNGISQYSTEVQQRTYGSFGVYARSVGDTALTASFSDLIVREVLPK